MIGVSTAKQIVDEVCQAIVDELSADHLSFPSEEKWKSIEEDFRNFWNFPLCIAAMDGKHFACEVEINS
jgi:hypothetical protein